MRKSTTEQGENMKLKNAGKDNEFLIITGTVHIGYGEDKQSVPFKSSYWSNVNGGGGTDFKWKDNTKGEYESVLVEFGDELLKFKKDFMCNYDLWYKEPMKLNIARNNSKATITKFKPKPFTPETGK
tara:strand:- start:64 stop:444 length:381 start_codon:yes stop_codon:yes gene_type:complete